MGASTAKNISATTAPMTALSGAFRHRRISRESGHALEILGHAIEYLTDEYVQVGFAAADDAGRLEAIRLLIKVNREIYFECPVAQGLRERFFSWLRRRES